MFISGKSAFLFSIYIADVPIVKLLSFLPKPVSIVCILAFLPKYICS